MVPSLNYLDMYCERAGNAAALAEPLNFITNLFFIYAGVMSFRALRHANVGGKKLDFWFLIAFMLAIGVGSGAWHLIPTKATLLMDVIPITLFINLYILSALRRLFQLSWPKVALYWGIYAVAGYLAQTHLPDDLLNGTIMYIPTYGALVLITLGLYARDRALGRVFVTILAFWTASLVFRTIDREVCEAFHLGTHFLWHTLNALVLWRLFAVLVGQRSANTAHSQSS